jgi:hypothetical protein
VCQALQSAVDLRGGHQLGFLDDAHPGEHPSIGDRRHGSTELRIKTARDRMID